MEKNNGMPRAVNAGQPKFEVWVYDMPGEGDLKIAEQSGKAVSVHMMRRHREKGSDSLIYRVPVGLKVLSVKDRRRGSDTKKRVGSMHRELAVEVEMVENAPKGILNGYDDGLGLSAFTAGTKFTLVYCPDDGTKAARVSRSSDALYAQPAAADEGALETGDATS